MIAPSGYAELCFTTNFIFLTDASHPEEFVVWAAELGLAAIATTEQFAGRGGAVLQCVTRLAARG